MNNNVSTADLVQLVVGFGVLAICGYFIRGTANLLLKLVLAVFAFGGAVTALNAIPTNELHIRISLVVVILALVIGGWLFASSKVIGTIVLALGILALIGGGAWDADLWSTHTSLGDLFTTGWDAIKGLFSDANKGVKRINQ